MTTITLSLVFTLVVHIRKWKMLAFLCNVLTERRVTSAPIRIILLDAKYCDCKKHSIVYQLGDFAIQ